MLEKTKSNIITQKVPNIRYSQTSLNTTQTSEIDYNLYCFSQGYKNKEKGFWRGVLRNKNIDFDLRLNKEWNRRIELEDDISLSETQSQISNVDSEILSFVSDKDIGWDKNLFQNFKKKQSGIKKQKNKEWLLSNGIKRTQVELRTQNYKQFEESERLKKQKKAEKEKDTKLTQELILDYNKYQTTQGTKKLQSGEYTISQKSYMKSYAASDTKKTGSSSYSINEQTTDSYNKYGKDYQKRVETYQIKKDIFNAPEKKNIGSNKYQKSPKMATQQQGSKYGSDNKYYGDKKQEVIIGQNIKYNKYNKNSDQNRDFTIKEFTTEDRPSNLGRLEVSVERKSKERIERKPGSRTHDRVYSSKKRKSLVDKYGNTITNISRKNVDTSKKKEKKERLENRVSVEISVGKKKKIEGRKPESRKHSRIHSSKKKRVSVDSEGKPLTNTRRLNVDTSKKKEKRERLENRKSIEISVGKKEKKPSKEVKPRRHSKIHSSKKRKSLVDEYGKPIANTSRINIDTSSKKEKKERLENRKSIEISVGKKKKQEGRKTSSRRHSRIESGKKKRMQSYDEDGNLITNVSRLRVGIEKGKVIYAQKEDFDKYEDKNHQRYQAFNTNIVIKSKYQMTTPTKKQDKKQEIKTSYTKVQNVYQYPQKSQKEEAIIHRRQYTLPGQVSATKTSEAGSAFFTNKYQYQKIKKDDKNIMQPKSDYKSTTHIAKDSKTKTYGSSATSKYQQSSYISTSKLNTDVSNVSTGKYNKFDGKRIETTKDNIFGQSIQQIKKRDYSYNKDLVTKRSDKDKDKGMKTPLVQKQTKTTKTLSENKEKKLDFSKYYKSYKTETKETKENNRYNYPQSKPVGKVDNKDIYEYYPMPQSSSIKTTTSVKTNVSDKKGVTIDLGKYNIAGKFNLNKSISSSKKDTEKERDKYKLSIGYQSSDFSEETATTKYKRNKSTLPSNKLTSMAYFKLQFLTTKQVCEKFWNQIDNGELSISMFDQRTSGNSLKLSKFLSPEKNRKSKISNISNENTEISFKDKFRFSGNTSINGVSRKINFGNSERGRQSIKA